MFPGPQQHPTDPTQKAKDRVVLEIFSKVITSYYKCMFAKEDEAKESALKDMIENLKYTESELKKRGSKFFCGETPGMLDWMMWPWLERVPVLHKMGITIPEMPGMDEYMTCMWQTDVVKDYGLSVESHYKFMKQYMDQKETINYDFLLTE
jgi:glutathionyl-hydroquinone reductase